MLIYYLAAFSLWGILAFLVLRFFAGCGDGDYES